MEGKPVMEKYCFVTHGVRVCRFLCFGWPLAILLLLFTVAQLFTLCVHILETRWACLCRLGGNLDPGISFLAWLRPLFVLVRCFLCWRNFACRRCLVFGGENPLQSQPTCPSTQSEGGRQVTLFSVQRLLPSAELTQDQHSPIGR